MTATRSLFVLLALAAAPAAAQQGQEFFIPPTPGQPAGQPRPGQATQPAQPGRPPGPGQTTPQAQPGQRPPQRPAALPPGQPPPTALIGIVDIQEIQRDSTAFNQVREEIERRRQRLNEDLQREQASWRDLQTQLANQRATMPADQQRQRERDLQDRITDSQRIFRERSRLIEQTAQAALVEIEGTLGGVIRQVAGSRQVNLVLPRPLVIYNEPAFDLTEEVKRQFNASLRSVRMPPEAPVEAAPPAPTAQQTPPATPAAQQPPRPAGTPTATPAATPAPTPAPAPPQQQGQRR